MMGYVEEARVSAGYQQPLKRDDNMRYQTPLALSHDDVIFTLVILIP